MPRLTRIRLTGNAARKPIMSAATSPAQKTTSVSPAFSMPGKYISVRLSAISITIMLNVSVVKTIRDATGNPIPARKSGKIPSKYPKKSPPIIPMVRVKKNDRPKSVPTTIPRISPKPHVLANHAVKNHIMV